MWAKQKESGFTIVELLIVVVVIAILAAITIVAYNGIQNRAKASAAQSGLSQQAKKLALWKVQNGDVYPADLASAQEQGMLAASGDLQYTKYIASPDRMNFCLTVQQGSDTRWSVTSTSSTPRSGECVINLLVNTSVESTSISALQNIGSTGDRTIQRTAVPDAYSGANVLRLTVGASGGVAGYGSLSPSVPPGRYTGSLWIRSNVAIAINPYFEGSSTRTNVAQSSQVTLTPGVWARIWRTIDVTAAGTVKVGFLAGGAGTTAQGNYVEIDGFTLTEGSTVYDFFDGASPSWQWTGAEHASTSFGPATQ